MTAHLYETATHEVQQVHTGACVYIIKTGKNLYKIGKTRDLLKRLNGYHTHLPVIFKVVRQYIASNMTELEESLHIVFQHKRIKGEWFQLTNDDLVICDNIARNFALTTLQKQAGKKSNITYSDMPLLQVMEANEKYLRDYSHIANDIKLGLSTNEIFELYEGTVSKLTIDTVRRLLKYQTPNSEFLSRWINVVNDLANDCSENDIIAKYQGEVTRTTIQMIKRILRNQLY
jgi:hypothetical protein